MRQTILQQTIPAAAALAAFLLGGCTLTGPGGAVSEVPPVEWAPQNYAGVEDSSVEVPLSDAADGPLIVVRRINGKEAGTLNFKVSKDAEGGIVIDANAAEVRAFDAFAFRAEVEAVIAEANAAGLVEIAPEAGDVIDGIVQAACRIAAASC